VPYVPGKNTTLTFGGTTLKGTSSNVDREVGEVDYTNFTSNGEFEGGTDIKKTTFSAEIVVNDASVDTLEPGATGTYTKAVTGGRTVTGAAYILRVGMRSAPRGAFTKSVSGSCTGAVTES
jgi:hypothetical protein